jgi:hypothetical protein
MGVKIQLFEDGADRSDFCLWGWMKSEVYIEKVNTRDELVARIINNKKTIPLQTWTGPEGSRRLRPPDFKTIGT